MKYQAFAWDVYPNGGVKGVAKVFGDMEEAQDWLKFQPQALRLVCPNNLSHEMFELIQRGADWQQENDITGLN